jgi:hypothetical protein
MNSRADGNDVRAGSAPGDGGAGPADASRLPEEDGVWPRSFDPSVPNVARMYDFMLGGKDNFQVDRDAVAKVLEALPEGIEVVRQNRAFLRRVVRFLAGEAGIRQFLDLGSGLPTMQNVHEVAEEVKRLVGEVLEAVPAGSYLVVSHGTSDYITDDSAAGLSDAYADSAAGGTTPRPRGQILEFFDGWDLVEPGLVGIEFWRPEQPVSADRTVYYYGGVARKPQR